MNLYVICYSNPNQSSHTTSMAMAMASETGTSTSLSSMSSSLSSLIATPALHSRSILSSMPFKSSVISDKIKIDNDTNIQQKQRHTTMTKTKLKRSLASSSSASVSVSESESQSQSQSSATLTTSILSWNLTTPDVDNLNNSVNNTKTVAVSNDALLRLAVLYNQHRTKRTYHRYPETDNSAIDHRNKNEDKIIPIMDAINEDLRIDNDDPSKSLPVWDTYDVINQFYMELGKDDYSNY